MKKHLTVGALALLWAGISLSSATAPAAPAAAPVAQVASAPAQAAQGAPGGEAANRIVVSDFMFQPTTLTIKAGSTVTWVNMDDEPHTVVSATGLFRSAALDTNGTFSYKFDQPGTYLFACSIHPRMTGTIVVQ